MNSLSPFPYEASNRGGRSLSSQTISKSPLFWRMRDGLGDVRGKQEHLERCEEIELARSVMTVPIASWTA